MHNDVTYQWNKNEIDSKDHEVKKADGIESILGWFHTSYLEWFSLYDIHVDVNLLIYLKEDLRLPGTTFSNSDGNLSLMGLYKGHPNTKCASSSTTI